MLFIDDFLHDLVLRLMILLSEHSHYYFSPFILLIFILLEKCVIHS